MRAKATALIQPSRPGRTTAGQCEEQIALGRGVMPTQRHAAAPVIQENVGTEWAVRPKILPICYGFRAPPV